MLFSPTPNNRRIQLRISERRFLLMAGDALAVIASVVIALYVWSRVAEEQFSIEFVFPQSYWFFVLVGLWLMIASANDFYDLNVVGDATAAVERLFMITLQLIAVYLTIFVVSPTGTLPRLFILYYGASSFLLIAIWRAVNPALIGWASAPRRVFVVGTDESAKTIIYAINLHGQQTYQICGVIGQPNDVGSNIMGVPVIGTGDQLYNLVERNNVTELIITSVPDVDNSLFRGVMEAYDHGVELIPMPILYERITGRVPVNHVKNNWALVLPIAGLSLFDPYPLAQRIMDWFFALLGLLLFIVTFPVLAFLIRMDSPGGVFYRQVRVGLNGRQFKIVKYRTMVADAEKDTGAVFSQKGDPRVTRIGMFMRKTRLDELPQIYNVFRGQMSIVGPRPERPEHTERLIEKIPFYRTRLIVRPGLTGWAQVRYDYGSNDVDALVKLEYDLYYIRNQNVLLDLTIIVRTIGKVARMGGI